MKSKLSLLVLVVVVVFAAAVPSAAAPLSRPCAPGAAYNPACDVDQDGTINITDIQLTAGHWNQTGTWVSDNGHDHLGQTWTGTNNRLAIQGTFGFPAIAPLVLTNSGPGDGLWITQAGFSGLTVSAAGTNGVYVGTAGNSGVYIDWAQQDGVRITDAADDGIQIGDGNNFPQYGLVVPSPGTPGDTLLPNTAAASGQWALWTTDNIQAGNIFASAQMLMAVVAGDETLYPGDVVAAAGLADSIPGGHAKLAKVRLAGREFGNVVGVVHSRMALRPLPGKDGEQVLRSIEGRALPSEYVAIIVLGVTQVKVQDEPPVQLGQRLTVAETPGQARAMRTVEVEGIQIDESGPTLGVALEAPKDGLVWVLVDPQ